MKFLVPLFILVTLSLCAPLRKPLLEEDDHPLAQTTTDLPSFLHISHEEGEEGDGSDMLVSSGKGLVAGGKGFRLDLNVGATVPGPAVPDRGAGDKRCSVLSVLRGPSLRKILMFIYAKELDYGFEDCLGLVEQQVALATDSDVLVDGGEFAPARLERAMRFIKGLERHQNTAPQILACSRGALQRLQNIYPTVAYRRCLMENPVTAEGIPAASLETALAEGGEEDQDHGDFGYRQGDDAEEDDDDLLVAGGKGFSVRVEGGAVSPQVMAAFDKNSRCFSPNEMAAAWAQAAQDAGHARKCMRSADRIRVMANVRTADLPPIPGKIVLPHIIEPPKNIEKVDLKNYASTEDIEAAMKDEVDATAKAEFKRFVSFWLSNYATQHNVHAGLHGLPYRLFKGLPKKTAFTRALNEFADDRWNPEPGASNPAPRRRRGEGARYGSGVLPVTGDPMETPSDITMRENQGPNLGRTN